MEGDAPVDTDDQKTKVVAQTDTRAEGKMVE
jgi:hypothetical protein